MKLKSAITITLTYALFALISIGVNLGVQYLVGLVYRGSYDIYFALILGTGAGLLVKYLLDKRWIFRYVSGSLGRGVRTFLLYTLMGIVTTGIFWITELTFHRFVPLDNARYIGGALGLIAGYTVKYFLDRALVFTPHREKSNHDPQSL